MEWVTIPSQKLVDKIKHRLAEVNQELKDIDENELDEYELECELYGMKDAYECVLRDIEGLKLEQLS